MDYKKKLTGTSFGLPPTVMELVCEKMYKEVENQIRKEMDEFFKEQAKKHKKEKKKKEDKYKRMWGNI